MSKFAKVVMPLIMNVEVLENTFNVMDLENTLNVDDFENCATGEELEAAILDV